MNGGTSLVSGDSFYFSEDGLWLEQGGQRTLLASVKAENLNLCGQWLYYTDNDTVYRMSPAGGAAESVYTADGYIVQLYVMGQELRFVSNGGAYPYDMNDGQLESLACPADVKRLIPTPYGNLYLTGAYFNYTLWAETTSLLSGVDSAYPEGEDWLVVVNASGTWQADIQSMFQGSISLQDYSLYQDQIPAVSLSDEELASSEAAYLQSDAYLQQHAMLEEYTDNGIATISTSTVRSKTLTPNQQNIVLRAQQMSEVKWKCLKTIYSWGGNDQSYVSGNSSWGSKVVATDGTVSYGQFLEGKTYKGVPYAQAVGTGYVGWDISLKQFLEATANSSSKFYTSNSTYGRTAPYYGSDCTGFVSYAWDLPYRSLGQTLLSFSEYIGVTNEQGLYKLQVGDCLNLITEHVALVTDIGYDSAGRIVSVEITEQTPCKMRVTCYGEKIDGRSYDYTGQMSYLQTYYLNKGYKIYRRDCSSRPNVREPEDEAGLSYATAPTMSAVPQGPASAKVTLSHADKGAVIYYTTDGSAPSTSSKRYTGPFTVSKSTTIRAVAKVPGYENSFPLNETLQMSVQPTLQASGSSSGSGLFLSNGVYYADPNAKLTLKGESGVTVYYTTDGSNPTLNSTKVTSSTSIAVKDGMTIKAFAAGNGVVPSTVASFTVKTGQLYTITVDDPFGFVSPAGSVSVLSGSSVTFKIGSTNGYTLGNVKVDGKSVGAVKEYTFSKVSANHTLKAEVKLPFSDVSSDSWYVDAVAFAANKGIFNGISSSKFDPNGAMNRGMFITVLGRYAKVDSSIANWSGQMGLTNGSDIYVRSGTSTSTAQVTLIAAAGQYIKVTGTVAASKSQDGAVWYQVEYNGRKGYVRSVMPSNNKTLMYVCQFNDLSGSDISYCSGYAQWANLNGIVTGTSDTTFSPRGAISRQDICKVLYEYLTDYKGMSLPTGSAGFKDAAKVSSYARTAVNAMAAIGVITGDQNGNFNPTTAATRAEVAAIFMRLDQYLNG